MVHFSEEFEVKVRVHQVCLLNSLLHMMVWEALSSGFRASCPQGLLCTCDFISESKKYMERIEDLFICLPVARYPL